MRDVIKFAAGLFVLLGAVVFAICAISSLGILSNEGGLAGSTMEATLMAFGGLVAGASIVLVGGTAFLLASIDERLEHALKKSGLAAPPPVDDLAAAQIG